MRVRIASISVTTAFLTIDHFPNLVLLLIVSFFFYDFDRFLAHIALVIPFFADLKMTLVMIKVKWTFCTSIVDTFKFSSLHFFYFCTIWFYEFTENISAVSAFIIATDSICTFKTKLADVFVTSVTGLRFNCQLVAIRTRHFLL